MKLNLYFDGGCWPNPGPAYGSYEVEEVGGQFHLRAERFGLGRRTNNEAEYLALQRALEDLRDSLKQRGIEPSKASVHVFSDSLFLVRRVSGQKKQESAKYMKTEYDRARAARMRELAEGCCRLLAHYASFTIKWRGRETNVARFGH